MVPTFTSDVIQTFLDAVPQDLRTLPIYKELVNEVRAANLKVGSEAPDISGLTPDGEEVTLSDFKGKYVFIDFWASWCAPCLLEMDNVKAVYQKYHEKGFEIVGLSFDRGRQPWINAIVDHKLNWIHLSDLKYWNSEASVVYGISSIPANILLDGNGIIVATDLRGEELLRKMRQIFRY
jgi:peroxiredoxin